MKVTIKGEMTIGDLGTAFQLALARCQFDKDKHYVKGATLYFNLYDTETHEMQEVWEQGEKVDGMTFVTSVEQARQKVAKKQRGKG